MTLQELQQLHMQQLSKAFGVANAEAVAKDNKIVRALGTKNA